MNTVVMCCGKVCSGKSTLSAFLESELRYVAFSADSWMLHFYGQIEDRDQFDTSLEKCKSMIYRVAEKVLTLGASVVFDFGFWTRKERQTVRERFESLGYRVLLLYFDVSFEAQKRNLESRLHSQDKESYAFDTTTLHWLNDRFEAPSMDEGTVLFRSDSDFLSSTFGVILAPRVGL